MIREVEEKDFQLLTKIYKEIFSTNISFNEEFNNKGIATKLLNNMLSNLNGVLNVTLEVNDSNTKAINFYLKNGFKAVSKREKYYRDGHDAYLMMKVI